MTSVHPSNIGKPVEKIHPSSMPDAKGDDVANGLTTLVEHSAWNPNLKATIHAPMHTVMHLSWIHELVPGIEKLASEHHVGNYVAMRGNPEPFFESMPIYARLGMHLLFYGKEEIKLLGDKHVEDLLREQSVKQGRLFDEPKSAENIASFIDTYSIQTSELLQPDISKYTSFNEFFYRKLRPDARPVQNGEDPSVICSAADCRLTVYPTVELAKKFWVKGNNFTIPNLLGLSATDPKVAAFQNAGLAIFRLAPADYHRFHSPISGEVGEIVHIPGQYYTVNPQAVNEQGFDVFTANTRSVLYMKETSTGLPVAFVAIGALLVGSIEWTGGKQKGSKVERADELGYFAYGGSTVVCVFAKDLIKFDDDLVANSEQPIETLVKVGYSIGKVPKN